MSDKEQLFRLHTLREKAEVHQFQCCVTWQNRLYIGTTDGGIMVYQINKKDGHEWGAQGIRIQKTGGGKPITQMVVVADLKVLLVLVGGNLQQHQLDEAQEFTNQLVIGSHISQIAVKKERGKFTVAALQRKKVILYDWRESKTFGLARELTIVEGCTSVSWCGKSLLMAFKNEFVLLDVKTHKLDPLFETSDLDCPVTNMPPTKELLISQDGAGVRVTHEGQPVQPGLSWGSLPTVMGYHHPYLLSVHDGNSIDVHCPMLDTPDPDAGIPPSQSLTLKYVNKLSINNFVNFDLANPIKNPSGYEAARSEIRRDFLVAITTVNSAFLIDMVSIADQAKSACMSKNFEHALKLTEMCPGEVSPAEIQEIRLRYGLDFFNNKQYSKAIEQFKKGKADARFVASLLPGFLPAHIEKTFRFPFGKANKPDLRDLTSAQRNEALSAVVQYLVPLRRPPKPKEDKKKKDSKESDTLSNDSFDLGAQLGLKKDEEEKKEEIPLTEDEIAIQETIDTAVLRAYAELGRDMDVLTFLQKPNYCVVADTELLLTSRQEYIALCTFWLNLGEYEKVLKFCRVIGIHGINDDTMTMKATLASSPLADYLTFALPKTEYPKSGFSTQRQLERKIRDFIKKQTVDAQDVDEATAAGQGNEERMTNQLVGIMMTIHTLKNLPADAPKARLLLNEYSIWVLANVDPSFSLEIYNGAAMKSEPREILKILKSEDIKRGMVNVAELQARYLDIVLGEEGGYRSDDSDLHNQRIQALINMLDSAQKREAAQKSLRKVLEKSEAYEPLLVLTWLTGKHKMLLCKECAIVYRRLKYHEEAINMYVNEVHDLEAAKRYAEEVSRDEEEDAFELLLKSLLKPKTAPAGSRRDANQSRLTEALEVVNQCPGVDARSALPLLPDETPLKQIRDFLKKAVRETSAKRRNKEVYHNVLRTLGLQSEVEASKLKRRSITVESSTLCRRCNRKIADAVFARYPNGVLVHQACLEKEYICPVTEVDFRKRAMLESYHADARLFRGD